MTVVAHSSAYVFLLCIHNLYIRLSMEKKVCVLLSHKKALHSVFPHCMNVLLFISERSVKDVCCQNVFFYSQK